MRSLYNLASSKPTRPSPSKSSSTKLSEASSSLVVSCRLSSEAPCKPHSHMCRRSSTTCLVAGATTSCTSAYIFIRVLRRRLESPESGILVSYATTVTLKTTGFWPLSWTRKFVRGIAVLSWLSYLTLHAAVKPKHVAVKPESRDGTPSKHVRLPPWKY